MTSKTFLTAALLSLFMVSACATSTAPTASNASAATPEVEAAPMAQAAEPVAEAPVTAEVEEKESDDDRMICRREAKTGSHFKVMRCATAAQRKREAEDAQEAIRRSSRSTLTDPET